MRNFFSNKVNMRAALITLSVIILLAIIKSFQLWRAASAAASFAPPPEAVTTAIAEEKVWRESIDLVGSLAAINGTTLSAEEPGRVEEILAQSGTQVKAGDVLLKIDTQLEQGQLKAAQARVTLARITLERSRSLRSENLNAKADLDRAESEFRQAEGERDAILAVIERKTLRAPFEGQLGIRAVNAGQFVERGTPLVAVHQLDSLYLNFSAPQRYVGGLKAGGEVRFSVDAFPDRSFQGEIGAIEPAISEATRSIAIQAIVKNSDLALRAGMFCKIQLELPESNTYVTIPASSISYAPYGDSVYVVQIEKDAGGAAQQNLQKTVRQQFVKIAARRGDRIALSSGLKAGDEVVSSGTFKLRPGAQIAIHNQLQPGSSLTPSPPDT
ncbi:MAG: efflux transporter periplasmic adaptor subunit [Proteobacteria bacterium]|nr:MAG: efflux transporter periplasmic adaptor subunit [Pseudomonadota bacterium]